MKKIVSKNLLIVVLVVLGGGMLMQSCTSGTNIVAAPSSWNFSISGSGSSGNSTSNVFYIGDTLKFQSTAPDNSVFQWTFGDGNSSTRPTPLYAFYSIPSDSLGNIIDDTVTLVVNNDVYHPVVKTIILKPPVPRISNVWNWTGGYFKKYGTCCPSLSDGPLHDTTFAITKIDDYTVNVFGANIHYRADSNFFSNSSSGLYHNATYLRYTKDTMFFQQNSGTDSGGYVITYYHLFN